MKIAEKYEDLKVPHLVDSVMEGRFVEEFAPGILPEIGSWPFRFRVLDDEVDRNAEPPYRLVKAIEATA